MVRSPETVTLLAGDVRVDIKPALGGAVTRFSKGGIDLFRRASPAVSDVVQTGCFPLVPFCNRIRDGRFAFDGKEVRLTPNLPPQRHPLHGQGWREPWRVSDFGDFAVTLDYRHRPGEWPWAYLARQRFEVDEAGLTITLECRNEADGPMPCGLGFHPFFDAPPDTVLDTRVSGVWTIDEEIMPVALEPAVGRYDLAERNIAGADLDNGYEGWSGSAEVRWPSRGAGVRITSAAPRFQVYAPADLPVLCAEPVTNANDALSRPSSEWPSLGIEVLQPGEALRLEARFEALTAKV